MYLFLTGVNMLSKYIVELYRMEVYELNMFLLHCSGRCAMGRQGLPLYFDDDRRCFFCPPVPLPQRSGSRDYLEGFCPSIPRQRTGENDLSPFSIAV